jgi:hypothetical protein
MRRSTILPKGVAIDESIPQAILIRSNWLRAAREG